MTEKRLKTSQINIRIDPKLKAEAEKAAAEDHRSLASLIEKLLSDYVKRGAGNDPLRSSFLSTNAALHSRGVLLCTKAS